jgi:hypothetical protein
LAAEETARISAVASIQQQLTDLLNGSPANLDTLAEIVALLNSGDGTLTSALAGIQTQVDNQRAAADARLDDLEASVSYLQGN